MSISCITYNTQIENPDFDRIYSLLSTDRKERVDRIKNPAAKLNSAICEHLLYFGINGAYPESPMDFTYEYGENGKPGILGLSRHFSFSHSKDMVICAINEAPVGCDVEFIGTPNYKLASRFFHPDENSRIMEITEPNAKKEEFYRIWTMKESYIKLTGRGLSEGLSSFCVIKNTLPVIFTNKTMEGYMISTCIWDNPRQAH